MSIRSDLFKRLRGGLPGGLFSPTVSDAEFEAYVQRILALNDQ